MAKKKLGMGSKFEAISKYYLDITEEQDKKKSEAFMKIVQLSEISENYNK